MELIVIIFINSLALISAKITSKMELIVIICVNLLASINAKIASKMELSLINLLALISAKIASRMELIVIICINTMVLISAKLLKNGINCNNFYHFFGINYCKNASKMQQKMEILEYFLFELIVIFFINLLA